MKPAGGWQSDTMRCRYENSVKAEVIPQNCGQVGKLNCLRDCAAQRRRYSRRMAVQNRIVKVQKRNRALVRFDQARIGKAILRAAQSIDGFAQDQLPGINDKIFSAQQTDEAIAGFLADT